MSKPSFYIEGIPVYQVFMDESYSNFPAYQMNPDYITVHETENYDEGADAEMHSRYLHNEAWGAQTSWHFTADDHCIYQHARIDQSCWHGGDGSGDGNRNSIAIETCENSDGDFKKAVKNVQALIRYLIETEGNKEIEPHTTWSGKDCPNNLLPVWDEFIEGIDTDKDISIEKPTPPKDNTSNSIVDYLNSINMDSSYEAREGYAEVYGIDGYKGTADQNIELLRKMQNGKPKKETSDYQGNSIVDYLKSIGVDHSFSNRQELAVQHGISGYEGKPEQNLKLLNDIRNGETKTSSKSSTKQVHLPARVETWGTYTLDEQPVSENISWYLTPAAYDGLTYEILDEPYPDVVTIETSKGKRNIYVGSDTSAVIK